MKELALENYLPVVCSLVPLEVFSKGTRIRPWKCFFADVVVLDCLVVMMFVVKALIINKIF